MLGTRSSPTWSKSSPQNSTGLKISLPDDATSCALTFRFWSYFWGGKEALLHHHRRHRLGACRVGAWNALSSVQVIRASDR
jgi:hypothetical protein